MSAASKRYSTHADSEEKETIISQLKTEIFELRQNQRGSLDLNSSIRTLEHKYNILSEEKIRNDNDYKNRNELNLKTIANLKTDIDLLKSTIAEKRIELRENKAETQAMKEIADHRAIDISKLKDEITGSIELNGKIKEEKRNLEAELAAVRDEKRKLLLKYDYSRADYEEYHFRVSELERVLRNLEADKAKSLKQQEQIQEATDNLNNDLRNKADNLKKVEQQIKFGEGDIRELENQISESERANEKAKSELAVHQKTHQQEVNKGADLQKRITKAEDTLKARDATIEELRREIDQFESAHKSNVSNNRQLSGELKELMKKVEELTLQNEEIIRELVEFSQKDEQVKKLLDRKKRINELKAKSENQTRQTVRYVGSPSRGSWNSSFSHRKY